MANLIFSFLVSVLLCKYSSAQYGNLMVNHTSIPDLDISLGDTRGFDPPGYICLIYPYREIVSGIQIKTFTTNYPSDCCKACQDNGQCTGWVHYPQGVIFNGHCSLKSNPTITLKNSPDGNTVAGIVNRDNLFNVQFYDNINWNGYCITWRGSKSAFTCHNLTRGGVSSVRTNGACLRLYDGKGCLGRSIVVYDESEFNQRLTLPGFNNIAQSFGPCYPYDYFFLPDDTCPARNADLQIIKADKPPPPNRHSLMSSLVYYGLVFYQRIPINTPTNPITSYSRGPGGRTEYLTARIRYRHLNTGTPTNDASRAYIRGLGGYYNHPSYPNDDAGHIIGRSLGGSGTAVYNLFPQNLKVNRGYWAQIERYIRLYLMRNTNATVSIEITFYFNNISNRTLGFAFVITFSNHPGHQISDCIENYQDPR